MRIRPFLAGLVLASLCIPASAGAAAGWSLTVYHATLAQEKLLDIFANRHFFEASYLVAMTVAKEFAGSKQGLTWEAEGQAVKHYGKQHHWETNAVLVARWHRFPWDRYVDTSVAVGEGLSYATRTSRVEAEDHENTSHLLNYLLFELTLGLPRYSHWHLSGRIHHRSGVFGLFNDVHGGSNFMGLGVTYRF